MKQLIASCLLLLLWTTGVHAVPLSEYLLNRKASNDYQNEELETAKSNTEELLQQSPENGKYLHNLAQINMKNDNIEDAIKHYNQALPLLKEEDRTTTELNLGAAYIANQELDPAIEIFRSLLNKNPQNSSAKHNLEVALSLKQLQEQQENQNQNQQQDNPESNENDTDSDPSESNSEKNESQDQKNADEQSQDPSSNEGNNSEQSPEEQRKNALSKDQEENAEKEAQAKAFLETLSQIEKEARKKYTKKQGIQGDIDYDW